MAEFDLGTAHGRIVIRSDNRGATQTAQAMVALERNIDQMNRALAGVERALNNFNNSTQQMEARLRSTNSELNRTHSSISRVAGVANSAVNGVRNFTTELSSLASQAIRTGEQLDSVTTAIERLGSVSGVLTGLVSGFGGVDNEMSNLPIWQRNILSVGRAISGYRAASGILTTFAGRVGTLVASTAAFATMASQFDAVRRNAGLMVGTMGMIFPQLNAVGNGFRALGGHMGVANDRMGLFTRSAIRTAQGMSQALSGVLLMGRALSGLARAAKLAAAGLSAVTLAAGAMKALGIIVLGLVDAIGQLSGALLILPGVIGQFAIATGVAKLGFDRLKVAIEAAGKTGEEFDEAIKELSPSMQDTARVMQSFAGRIKGLRDIAADQMFAGLADDIKNIGDVLVPFAEKGVAQVGRSLNSVKNAFRDFLIQPQTIRDLEEAFALTGVTINNVARGIQPFMNAMRDIGIEGMKVFTELTGGIGLASKQFEAFIANARKTGDIQRWIREGIQGFKDLGATISNVGQGFATIFQAFGADGENALARMRVATEKWAKSMENSARSGGLRTVAEALERMASVGLDVVQTALEQIGRVMETIAPFAERMSTAFGEGLVTAFETLGSAANILASALSKMSGLGDIVGTVLALGVAFKGLQLLMIPIIRTVQLMSGAFLALRGVSNVVGGVNGSLRAMGTSATVATVAMTGLRTAGSALLSFFGGPIGLAITGIIAALYSWKSASDGVTKANEQYSTNAQVAAEATDTLVEAFEKAGGVVDKGVFDTLVTNVRNLRQTMEDTAKTSTGFWQDLGAEFKDFFGGTSESLAGEEIKDSNAALNRSIDEVARRAREATTALKDLGVTDADVAAAISGGQGEWDAFNARLRTMGDAGNEAVAALAPMRAGFIAVQDSMTRMGPDTVALSEAFQTLASASSTASEKLDAIRSALVALGVLESSATEAAFQLTETIKQVGEAASGSLGPADQLGQALLNGAGGFNTSNAAAKLLHDELKKLGDALIETAAVGGDVNGAYNQMQGALDALATQSGLSRAEIDALAKTVGVAPDELSILVSLQGATESQAELRAVLVEASRFQGQAFSITAQAKTEQARAAIAALGFDVRLINSETGEIVVTGNTIDAQTKLQQILAAAQLVDQQNPNVPITTNAPTITGQVQALGNAVTTLPPGATVPVQTPGTPQAINELGLIQTMLLGMPPVVQMPVQAPGAPAVGQAVQEIQGAVTQLPPGVSMPVQAPGVDQAKGSLLEIFGMVQNPPPPVNVPVTAPGAPEAAIALGDVGVKATDAGTAVNNFASSVETAMGTAAGAISNMVSGATTQLQGLGATGTSAGAALGQGFADGILSKVDAARAAAIALAEAAAEPLPRSPAKIGPFSGRGWTPYRGASLALGFGEGIVKSIPQVRNDVMDFATEMSRVFDTINTALGAPATSFGANRTPGPGGKRYYRDTEVTDQDIAAKRNEKQRQQAEQEALDARFKESDERKKAEAEAEKERERASRKTSKGADEAVGSMQELADRFNLTITSNKRNEPGSFHNTGEAYDFAGSPEDMAALNAYLARVDPGARELFYDPGVSIDEGNRIGGIGGHSDHVHYVPSNSDSRATQQALNDSTTSTEKTTAVVEEELTTQEKMLKELEKSNTALVEQVDIAQNPTSSDADVIRALQAIDDGIATTSDRDVYEGLMEVRDAVKDDRGIKEYDPFEGASTDPVRDMISLAQGVMGIFNTLKSGLDAITEVTGILVRGISNTEDIHRLVDGFQSMASTAGELVSTFGNIVEVAGSLAALAGLAIPGIGPVVAAAGAIASGIGNVNAVVDLIQEGFKIGGWVLGNLLSGLAGGAEGPLSGNVHVLLDRNDNTIKTWSDANPEDKRVHNLGPSSSVTNNNGPQQLAVFAGPGVDPYTMMGEAMYAIRAANAGVYG